LLVEHKEKKQKTLFGDGILEYKALKFDLNKSTVQVNNSESVLINTETQVFALLILLIKSVDTPVSYEEIAKALSISKIQRNMQYIKRNIYNTFAKLGIKKDVAKEIRDYVVFTKNLGATIKS